MNIFGINFVEDCYACPESYDAYLNGDRIGYLRLRHGFFFAKYPHIGGTTVFEGHPIGDGRFADDTDRSHFMIKAAKALLEAHREHNPDMFEKLVEAAMKVIDEYEMSREGSVVNSIRNLREALRNAN